MPARSVPIVAAIIVLGATVVGATVRRGAPVAADPHDLYTTASNDMTRGDLQAADAALARLHAVIRSSPKWDPEGVFSRELLPPLEARLKRLQGAARKLDAFDTKVRADLKPPDPLKDTATVRNYTEWATSVIRRLRAERDQIIAAGLANPEDRAILSRTESYARTQRLLETDGLKQMADAAGDDILGLLAGDPNQESILLRFRQLKLDLMHAVADRDRLSAEVGRYQQALAASGVTLGADGRIETPGKEGDTPPAGESAPPQPSHRGLPFVWLILAIMGALGLVAWLAYARRRRLEALRRSLDDTRPGLVAGAHSHDADRDAA
jgi:hypothetical protein